MNSKAVFDIDCRACPRLAAFLDQVGKDYPDYHARPVPAFGDPEARLLVVGLAPGMHGANASGRPFTGDYAGILLYDTLHRFGFSSGPESRSTHDRLQLMDCRITNAVKCLPPQNKPLEAEVRACNSYLRNEVQGPPPPRVVLALGAVAHGAVLKACDQKPGAFRFGHGHLHRLPTGQWLLDSYHCSRYNTQTRRLSEEMFRAVFSQARSLLESG